MKMNVSDYEDMGGAPGNEEEAISAGAAWFLNRPSLRVLKREMRSKKSRIEKANPSTRSVLVNKLSESRILSDMTK